MTINRLKAKPRNSPEVEKLIADALALSASGSKVEDNFWEDKIFSRLTKLLKNQHQQVIETALDITFKSQISAFEILSDAVETTAESMAYEYLGQTYSVLLLAIPIIAQTKYSIPSGPFKASLASEFAINLHQHVIAKNALLSIVPWLYSIDQLPQSHSQTRLLLERMSESAVLQSDLKFELKDMPETISVLADPRFIICAVASLKGTPIFVWQEEEGQKVERSVSLKSLQESMKPHLALMLPGCEYEMMLPDAYFTNCREADKRVRPLSLKAAVNYLETTLGVKPSELSCVVAAFGNEIADEFRVSFAIKGHPDIIYGVVWPLYDRESISAEDIEDGGDNDTTMQLIADTLHLAGIGDVFKHAMLFVPEMCEDCGVPLFPSRSAEVVHAEMPIDTPAQQLLFH